MNIKHQKNLENLKDKNNKGKSKSTNNRETANRNYEGSFSSAASLYHKIAQENFDRDEILLNENIMEKKRRLMKEANWNDLLLWDKIRLFDAWCVISIMANLC